MPLSTINPIKIDRESRTLWSDPLKEWKSILEANQSLCPKQDCFHCLTKFTLGSSSTY